MEAKKCDRCGKFYEEFNSTYEVNKLLYTTTGSERFAFARKRLDLCLDCADALVRFLYNETPPERKKSNLEWLIENWEATKEAVHSKINCKIVHYAKYGKPCDAPFPDDYCSECEFYEKCGANEVTLLKALAEPHHERTTNDDKVQKISFR